MSEAPALSLRDPGASPAEIRERAEAQGAAPAAVHLLMGRGVRDADDQARWLRSRLADLRPPQAMAGFEPSLELLQDAVVNRRRVGVFGDYDVDGVTTAAILTTYLEALGVEVVPRVASRDAGYGFGVADAQALAEAGAEVVLTGDCGTSDHEALAWLQTRGIPSAVIDHHQVPETMPPATALLNPHQPGCAFPFKGLCSAGVAFYLCASLRTALARAQRRESLPDPRNWLDMVALGTVCDMVPLTDENRILVRHGLGVLSQRRRPGLRALLDASGVGLDEALDASHLGFRLGPRLNAPGRLGPAEPSLALLRAESAPEARAMAARIESCNARRRDLQEKIVADAEAKLAADASTLHRHGLVVASERWLHGIVGIAASTLVQRYRRPTLVLAIDRARGEARGSVRTHGDIDVRAALHACAPLLRRYGGHRAAAGVTMDASAIPRLVEAFDAAVAEQHAARGGVVHGGEGYDGPLALADIDAGFMDAIEGLGPYGVGFPAPRYLLEEAEVDHVRILREKHLSLVLRQGGVLVDAIAFGQGGVPVVVGDRVACLYVPVRNCFRGRWRLQLQLDAVWPLRRGF
ncbi:MAG: single-stranded-DNA-specific exonuclease RecJ [Nannocystaceae bacterium]